MLSVVSQPKAFTTARNLDTSERLMSVLAESRMPAESGLVRCTNSARQAQQLMLVRSVHGRRECHHTSSVEGSDFQPWCYSSSSVTSIVEIAWAGTAVASFEPSLVVRFSSALTLVASAAFEPSAAVHVVMERPASRSSVVLASLRLASSPCWSRNFEAAVDHTLLFRNLDELPSSVGKQDC